MASAAPPLDQLISQPLFAFSGLAGNAEFREGIARAGGCVKGMLEFADHHWYDRDDLLRVQTAARRRGAHALVTTDKDYVRLPPDWRWDLPLLVMGVDLVFIPDDQDWRRFLTSRLEKLFFKG